MMTCPSCQTDIDPVITRAGLGVHPTCPAIDVDPELIAVEVFTAIREAILSQPRSLQTAIGPSEVGHPCARRLGYKLAGAPAVNKADDVPWKPFVGTALHEQFANIMAGEEIRRFDDPTVTPRWHVEERVSVGEIGGQEITGSCDLFDAHHGVVIDFKTTSYNQIREKYRPHGPGRQYRTQAHLYGRGWQRAGHDVKHVMVIWLVRDGSYEQRHVWSEPYDEQVALDGLARLDTIQATVNVLGEDAFALLPAVESYCGHCPWFKSGATDLRTACPGVPREVGDPLDAMFGVPQAPAVMAGSTTQPLSAQSARKAGSA